jgi:hypothetical protein
LEPKTKTWSQPQNCFRILAKLGAKNKNPVTAPKLIPHFGKTWSQKTKTWSQPQNWFLILAKLGAKNKILVTSSVGQVSQLYDTRQVRFSQSSSQKGPVLPKKNSKFFYAEQGYQHLFF